MKKVTGNEERSGKDNRKYHARRNIILRKGLFYDYTRQEFEAFVPDSISLLNLFVSRQELNYS